MGLEVSQEAVPEPNIDRTTFNYNRYLGVWPALFESNKTAVTVDVLETGLILAFVMLAFCFYIVLPGIRGKERFFCFVRVTVSLFLGACVLLCNWGQEWEVDHIHTHTQYKAFTTEFIEADVGIKIGLRNVNITLKSTPDTPELKGERIDYNERFWWSYSWHQGRIGFGPYAAEIAQEFRAAQLKGLPYPILWVAEYFTFDGEGIRWGRHYRLAGWYAHMMSWTAFCFWLLANVLYFMNPRIGAYLTIIMGAFMILANIFWVSIRNANPLFIPFDNVALKPEFGWCFWLNLIAGVISIILGFAIVMVDIFAPELLATFFSVDILKDYEEFYPETEDTSVPASSKADEAKNGRNIEAASSAGSRSTSTSAPQYRKRGFTVRNKKPVAPPRRAPPSAEVDEGGIELYENAPNIRQINGNSDVSVDNVTFQEE